MRFLIAFASVLSTLGCAVVAVVPQCPEVTQTAKPWVYNWWMASAVDEKGLENQCAAFSFQNDFI